MKTKQAIPAMLESPPAVPESDAPSIPSPSNYMWVVLGLAVIAQMAGSFVSQGIYILIPIWKTDFNLSHAAAALVVTVMNGTQILSMIGLGRATDRYGERSVLSLAMTCMGLAAIAAAIFASSYIVLLCFIGLIGMLYAALQPGGTRVILRWFPPQQRGLAVGLRQAAVPLAMSIAAFILPLLAASWSWRTAVVVQGVISIAGGVFFWLFYREDAEDLSAGKKARQMPFRELVRVLGQDRAFWPVVLAGVAMSALQFSFITGAILFMANHFGIGLLLSASLFGVTQIIGIPGRVLLPTIIDRFWPGRREQCLGWTMIVFATAIICYALLPAETPRWLLYGLLAVIGFFGIGWYSLFVLQVAEISPKTAVASTLGLANTLCLLAMAVGPFIFGSIVDIAGYRTAWILLALPVALLAWSLLKLPMRTLK